VAYITACTTVQAVIIIIIIIIIIIVIIIITSVIAVTDVRAAELCLHCAELLLFCLFCLIFNDNSCICKVTVWQLVVTFHIRNSIQWRSHGVTGAQGAHAPALPAPGHENRANPYFWGGSGVGVGVGSR